MLYLLFMVDESKTRVLLLVYGLFTLTCIYENKDV